MKKPLMRYKFIILCILFLLVTSIGLGAFFMVNKIKVNKINVKSFGAKGDGKTDDTTAIQTAINSVSSNFSLEFPEGTYIIDTLSIKDKSNFKIVMKGWAIHKGDSNKAIFNIENCSYFTITPMVKPPTPWKGGIAIQLSDSNNGDISNGTVNFINENITTAGDFIRIKSNVHHIRVNNNTFKGAWGVLSNDGVGVYDIDITRNKFYGCKPYYSADLIEFNHPTNSANNITISDNSFQGTKKSTTGGICIGVANCEYVTIKGNTILDSGFDGIHVEDRSKHITVENNLINNCSGFPVSICLGVEDAMIQNNRILQSGPEIGDVVFYCSGDSTRKNKNIKIKDNTMDGGSVLRTKYVLLMTYCTQVEVSNNIMKNGRFGGFCDSDEGYNTFTKNRFESNNIGLEVGGKANKATIVEDNKYLDNKSDYVKLP
jgi:parallel beta-helix repeat protein